ncbi:hypothetical protein [Streptomyces sp. CBMA156]|uniref:hypothetical protein n=1 Tax=Streptomyces sp. CBMA156 TaxID=1930280 RepID=UPI001661C5C6|nr:hypothetical protein [Streptomyces sp. CBMA156]
MALDERPQFAALPGADLQGGVLIPAGRPDDRLPLSPLEVLTGRYVHGEKQKAWWDHLTTLIELEALAAVQADPEAPVDAVLALVPDVHAAIDSVGANLRVRVPEARRVGRVSSPAEHPG